MGTEPLLPPIGWAGIKKPPETLRIKGPGLAGIGRATWAFLSVSSSKAIRGGSSLLVF